MIGIVIDSEHFMRLSEATRRELTAFFGQEFSPPARPEAPGVGTWDPNSDDPYPLSLREAKELVRGLSEPSRAVLRLFCEHYDGEVGRAGLEELLALTGHADSQRLRKSIAGITRRLRTVTGHKQAWLIDWLDEDWVWDAEKRGYVRGEYRIARPAIEALCQAFHGEPGREQGSRRKQVIRS